MTPALTSSAGKALQIDARTGRVTLEGSTSALAFDMHDYGYIWLSPCRPFVRSATITYTSGTDIINCPDPIFNEDMVGQYIYLDGAWRRLRVYRSLRSMRVTGNMTNGGTETTQIVTMNEITISGAQLTLLETEFVPRVR